MHKCILLCILPLIYGYTINFKDLIDTTQPETFVNLTLDDFSNSTYLEEADIKQVILDELARNGDELGSDVLNFLDNPISESGKFEGDIELPPGANISVSNPNYWSEAYAAIKDKRRIWPKGVVPYLISSNYGNYARAKIASAIEDFHKFQTILIRTINYIKSSVLTPWVTCLQFVPRSPNQVDYIIIRPKLGCGSLIGRMGGDQVVSLSAGCINTKTIIHELMHAVGFYHEQARYDRDKYVTIHWNNIVASPKILEQFQKQDASVITVLGTPYDQHSVMHYGSSEFARQSNLTTITAKDGGTLSNDHGLTPTDILKLNKLYGCHQSSSTYTDTSVPQTTSKLVNDYPHFNIDEHQPVYSQSLNLRCEARHLRSRNDSGFFVATARFVSYNRTRAATLLHVDTDTFEARTAYTLNGPNITSTISGQQICLDVFHIADYDVGNDHKAYLSLTWYNAFPKERWHYSTVLVKLDIFGNVERYLINPCNFSYSPKSIIPKTAYQSLKVLDNGQIILTCNQLPFFKVFSSSLEEMNEVAIDATSSERFEFKSISNHGSELSLFDHKSQTIFKYNMHNWELEKILIDCDCYEVYMQSDGLAIGAKLSHGGVDVFVNRTIALSLNISADYVISLGDYIVALVDVLKGKSLRKYRLM